MSVMHGSGSQRNWSPLRLLLVFGVALLVTLYLLIFHLQTTTVNVSVEATRHKENYQLAHNNLQSLLSNKLFIDEVIKGVKRDAQAQRDARENAQREVDDLRYNINFANKSIIVLQATVQELRSKVENLQSQLELLDSNSHRENATVAVAIRSEIAMWKKKLHELTLKSTLPNEVITTANYRRQPRAGNKLQNAINRRNAIDRQIVTTDLDKFV